MKPEQSVYNKLHKFSAKEEPMKVELAIADDLSKIASELDSLSSSYLDALQVAERLEAEYKQFLQAQKAIISLAKNANKLVSVEGKYVDKVYKGFELLGKYEDMAQRLGVNPKESAEYNKADSAVAKASKIQKSSSSPSGIVNEIKRGLGI